jgi:hypothetical protein
VPAASECVSQSRLPRQALSENKAKPIAEKIKF